MNDDIAIKVDAVSKTFKLPHEKNNSIKGAVVNFYRREKTFETQEALQKISFEVKKGEFFGIVGRNGSGKSTLLKLMAGIYSPTQGHIQTNGKITPFIELGVGFNPELTGRENVFLNGALLGFNRSDMLAMYDDIVAFAELSKFMDQKLKNYSSGMQVRLAFSIAIKAQSDILIMDEVLAVGDAAFQKKCFDVFRRLKRAKQTIILVTHDMGNVEKFCDRVLVLDKGVQLGVATPAEASTMYARLNVESVQEPALKDKAADGNEVEVNANRWGSGQVTVKSVMINGKRKNAVLETNQALRLKITVERDEQHKNLPLLVGLAFHNQDDVTVAGPNTHYATLNPKATEIEYVVDRLPFAPGEYLVTIAVFDKETQDAYDFLDRYAVFTVIADHSINGVMELEGQWQTN